LHKLALIHEVGNAVPPSTHTNDEPAA
jgi:hypothetical protein